MKALINYLNWWGKGGHLEAVKGLVNYLSSAQASRWIVIWNHPLSSGGKAIQSIDCEQVCRCHKRVGSHGEMSHWLPLGWWLVHLSCDVSAVITYRAWMVVGSRSTLTAGDITVFTCWVCWLWAHTPQFMRGWWWGLGQHSLMEASLSLLAESAGCELTHPSLCVCGGGV